MPLKNGLRNYLVLLLATGLVLISMALWLNLKNKENLNKMPELYDPTIQRPEEQNQARMLARVLFSETKDVEDAKNIASVIVNRTKRPERFGATIQDVVYAPKQFSGVYGNEWNKALNQKFTDKEAEIYKQLLQVAYQAVTGKLEDKTGGADHYFNPKIVKPKWSAKMTKTTENKNHSYYKE
jgi:spore germination cell wall hydrolase CwlJ-like protein